MKFWFNFTVVAVIILGACLRLINIGSFPPRGETQDEFAWTFSGASLLQEGSPTGWSYFPYDRHENTQIGGNYYPIVKPFLDHPPLFGLVPGLIQYASGQNWREPLPIANLRMGMVLIAGVNLWLFYVVAKKWWGEKPALLGLLLYATIPSVIFAQRLIVAENLLTTWMLVYMWLLSMDGRRRWHWLGLITVGAAAVLTKIAGIVIPVAGAIWLWQNKDPRWRASVLGFGVGSALTLLYASLFNLELFLKIQVLQGKFRLSSLANFVHGFFAQNKIGSTQLFDPAMGLAKLALPALFLMDKKPKWFGIFATQVAAQVIFIMLAVGEYVSSTSSMNRAGPSLYGWYFFPLLTLAVMALSWVMWQVLENHNRWGFLVIALVWLPQVRFFWAGGEDGQVVPRFASLALVLVVVAICAAPARRWRQAALGLIGIMLVVNTLVAVQESTEHRAATNSFMKYLY